MSVFITREMVRQAADEWRHNGEGGMLAQLVGSARKAWKRRETANELHALTDRELRDIGIYRGDIPRIVRQLDDRDHRLAPAASRTVCGPQARDAVVPA